MNKRFWFWRKHSDRLAAPPHTLAPQRLAREKLRRQFYFLLEDDHADTLGPQLVEYGLAALITINIIALMLSTMPELRAHEAVFVAIERLSVVVFTVEYILRIWCVAERLEDPLWGRVKFIFHPLMLIDLMAFAPGYFTGPLDLRFARSFRLIRILKRTRHSAALSLIIEVLRRKREELFSVALISVLMLVMASGMIYYAEHPTQPEAFSSIPESMWWAVMTMTPWATATSPPSPPRAESLVGWLR